MFPPANHRPRSRCTGEAICAAKPALRGGPSRARQSRAPISRPSAPQLAYLADGKSTATLSIPLSIAPHTQSKSFYVVIDQSEGGAPLGARTLTMVTLLPSG